MRHFRQIYSYQNRALLSFALVLALLVQGVFGTVGSCMMDMGDSAAVEAQTMSHEDHDMGDMHAQSGGEASVSMHGHECPPTGCDICNDKNCSQCSPSQFSAIIQQDPTFLKDARLAIPDQAKGKSVV